VDKLLKVRQAFFGLNAKISFVVQGARSRHVRAGWAIASSHATAAGFSAIATQLPLSAFKAC
jgi:hypothetical protein